jgi:hypothetical protein
MQPELPQLGGGSITDEDQTGNHMAGVDFAGPYTGST